MIGIDILSLKEFKRQLRIGGEAFMHRVYSEHERANSDTTHLAGIFCAKEAVCKATGIAAGDWQRIAITHAENGKPIAAIDGRSIAVSISHHGDYAVAVAVDTP